MKRKTLISMLAAMLALALCMFVVACGIADDEDDSSSAEHLHVLTAVAAVEATCATEGNRAYYVCECGKLFEDADATTETTLEAVKIAKLDHTYGNWNVTAEATCLADGLREKVCSECNDKVTEAIPALGHDEIPHAGQAATCTENGYNAYVTCSRCDYTTYTVIKALGHDYVFVAEVAATYENTGVMAHYECSRCDTKATKSGETYTEVTDADLVIAKRTLITGCSATTEEAGILHIETKKVKSMEYKGVYSVDGKAAYYFVGDGTKTNSETRFVTEGTDTSLPSADRIYNNYPAKAFSFKYKILNKSTAGVTDGEHWQYIVQILDPSYPILTFEPAVDGEWHEFTYTLTVDQIKLFAGFIVKMGSLDGEMLIADIKVETHEHISAWTKTTPATCEGAGEETGTCACGATTTRTITALGHDYKAVAEVAATYYETGVAAHYECARENCDTKATKSGETYTKVTDADLVLDKKTLLAETTAAERGTDGDYINTIVDGKLKYLDQKPADGTKYVMTANKNGQQVRAAYFSNSTPWTDELAGPDVQGNNWGFSEFRIALSGNITGISFEYRMIDTAPEGDVCQVEGVDSNGNHDKSWHMRHQIEYSNNVGYTNESRAVFGDRFLIADGAWHTVEFNVAKTGMKNILLKMYHFQGELLVTNYQVYVHTHDYTWETTTAATCEGTGEETGTCACGSTTTRDLAALGHDYKEVAEVAATYYEAGVAAHYECAREGCDELFVKDGETYKKTTAAELVLKKLSLIDNATAVATEPENHLHIETGKVKKMTYGGLYNVDNKDAYYFYNEKVAGNAETRFVTFGTDTTKTIYNTYVFAPQRVRSFSFAYKIVNSCTDGVADKPAVPYITQILGSDGSYDVLEFNPTLNGEWGSYSYTLSDAQIEKFAGFIVKMGGLNGEMLIANIEVDAISLIDGCETATEPEAVLELEEGKTKKMAYGGLYSVDDKVAYYFHTDLLDGWSETRFVTEGTDTKTKPDGVHYLFAPQTITSFSFEYKLRNISKTIITDDGANALCFSQIICSDSTYYPLALEMIADGKWHTVTYDVPEAQQALFSGFIVKLGRLKGEMLIANINAETVSLVEGCATATEPDAVLKLEEGKTKQMTYGGLYTVDGKAAYYFHTGTLLDWSETRFVTEGTDTTTKKGGKYTFAPKTVTSFSFEYKIRNISKTIITDDGANAPYFAQILGSDSQYYPLELNMIADGKWHTVTYEVAEAQQSLFSGFIVKMGRLKGEMLIANINATVVE